MKTFEELRESEFVPEQKRGAYSIVHYTNKHSGPKSSYSDHRNEALRIHKAARDKHDSAVAKKVVGSDNYAIMTVKHAHVDAVKKTVEKHGGKVTKINYKEI